MGDPRWSLRRRLIRKAGERIQPLEELLEPWPDLIERSATALEAAALACPLAENGGLDPSAEALLVDLAETLGATLVAVVTSERLRAAHGEAAHQEAAQTSRQALADFHKLLEDMGSQAAAAATQSVRRPFRFFGLKPAAAPRWLRSRALAPSLPGWPRLRERAERLLERCKTWRERPILSEPRLMVAELLAGSPAARTAMKAQGLKCWDCVVACTETLDEAAAYHPFDRDALLARLEPAASKTGAASEPEIDEKPAGATG